MAEQASYEVPPAQSRDGTVSSRYFAAASPSAGNVLVPSSSPPPSDPPYRGHRSLFEQNSDDSIPGLNQASLGGRSASSSAIDSLSAPSGFISNKRPVDAFSSLSLDANAREQTTSPVKLNGHDGERPRKRQNRGDSLASPDPIDLFDSPGSPEIMRPGQRRKPNTNLLSSPVSSDESLLESTRDVAGPSKPRLVRGQRANSTTSSTTEPPPNDAAYIRFKFSHPEHPVSRCSAAWQHSSGDEAKATALLNDPSWQPPLKSAPVAVVKRVQTPAELGRVKEVEEASKAERARFREKGKQSIIYAKAGPSSVAPPPAKAIPNNIKSSSATPARATPPIPVTPDSPEVGRPTKRLKRKVVESDSEPDYADDDEDNGDSASDDINEQAAFDYFNSASPEALQELTGMLTSIRIELF